MTRIFDNIELALGSHLVETLAESERIDAAVGYFNIRGWNLFSEVIESRPAGDTAVARVLIGMVHGDPEEQVLRMLPQPLGGLLSPWTGLPPNGSDSTSSCSKAEDPGLCRFSRGIDHREACSALSPRRPQIESPAWKAMVRLPLKALAPHRQRKKPTPGACRGRSATG